MATVHPVFPESRSSGKRSPGFEPVPGPEGAAGSVYRDSLAATVRDLAAQRTGPLLVTSTEAREGKSTVVAELGRALVRSGMREVLLVEANPAGSTLQAQLGITNARGASDLLHEVYLGEPGEASTALGIGDWLELLRAQGRTGELQVSEGSRICRVHIVDGAVWAVEDPLAPGDIRLGGLLVRSGRISERQRDGALRIQQERGRPLGDVLRLLGHVTGEHLVRVLMHQVKVRMRGLLALRDPACRFSDQAPEGAARATGAADPATEHIDRLVNGRLVPRLPVPFLTARIPAYLSAATPPGLHVLTAGSRPGELFAPRMLAAMGLLLRRLSRLHELVLVDGPPVSLTTPARNLVALADHVLLVVRTGGPDLASIQRALEELRRAGGTVAGVVLSHMDLDHADPLPAYFRPPGSPAGGAGEGSRSRHKRGDAERWA